jgi:uncharacterized membrane-anchored protein YhcB (DUF1043 family)
MIGVEMNIETITIVMLILSVGILLGQIFICIDRKSYKRNMNKHYREFEQKRRQIENDYFSQGIAPLIKKEPKKPKVFTEEDLWRKTKDEQ